MYRNKSFRPFNMFMSNSYIVLVRNKKKNIDKVIRSDSLYIVLHKKLTNRQTDREGGWRKGRKE